MSLRSDIRALPRPVWVVLIGTVINRFGGFVLIFLMLYLKDQGFSAARAGVVMSMYGVGGLLSSVAGGVLADRIGRRETIALSMFLSAAVMLVFSRAHGQVMLMILAACAGFGSELYRPAAAALITDLTRAGERVTAFAVYRLAINLGFALGPAVGGLLANRSFTLLFFGDAATSLIYGIIAITLLPRGRAAGGGHATGGSMRQALQDRDLVLFLGGAILCAFVFMQHVATYPLQIEAYGFSPATFGMLVSTNGVIVMLLELPLTTVTRRYRPRTVMAIGAVLVGTGFGLTGVAHTLPLLVASVLVWTLGEIIYMPVAAAYIADIAPPELRGRYMGMWGLSFGFGFVVAPLVGGAIFARSAGVLWALCFVFGLTAAALFRMARPAPRPQEEEA